MRAGIFGGTFDPPHVGHLILASEACVQLRLDQVTWLLTPVSPFKQAQNISSVEIRLEMLRAAIAGNPQFTLSRLDVDRPPPHYAADSLSLLCSQYPKVEWIYLMGGDSLRDLPTWYEPERLIAACSGIGVMRRARSNLDVSAVISQLPGLSQKLAWVDVPLLDISSFRIRHLARTGGAYRYYLPPEVYIIIQQNKLYLEDA